MSYLVFVLITGKTEPPIKDDKKESEETDAWQRPARKHKRKSSRAATEERRPMEALDGFDPEDDFPKAKTSNRFTKHRPRLKSRKYESADEEPQGYSHSHRDRHGDGDTLENEEPAPKDDYRNDKRNKPDDKSRYSHRVVRRKPRDKFERRSESSERENADKSESDVDRWMSMRSGLGRAPGPEPFQDVEDEPDLRQRLEPPLREPPIRETPVREPPPKSVDEDEDIRSVKPTRGKGKKPKNYDEYNDYYDMKRVMNIKNKLPSLLRRTTGK